MIVMKIITISMLKLVNSSCMELSLMGGVSADFLNSPDDDEPGL